MEIGAQFYTIRDYCKDLNSLEESLKKVAAIGYKTIQLSGVCAYDPAWIKEKLVENGLRCVLTHSPCDRMIAETEAVCAEHDVYDCKHIGIGYYDIAKEGMFSMEVETIAKALELCVSAAVKDWKENH